MNAVTTRAGLAKRLLITTLASSMLTIGLASVPIAAQAADPVPPPALPETVSADPLPTWQLTGVVWSQVVVGNTVYATGSFTKARPAGMWAGGPTEINVSNIFAYDIRTGNRLASFDHSLNAQGLSIVASPDGSRVYVGGDFTTVDGQVRQHVAAFNTATGALVNDFAPLVNGQVKALTATNDTVFVGGSFESAAGQVRRRLASFTASSGQLNTWAPTADDGYVWSMTTTPDKTKVVIGGQFSTLNGLAVYGMGAVDRVTGASLPWAANTVIKDSGGGAIDALKSDGDYVYGAGYAYGAGGKFEGTFSLNPNDGSIRWLNDCQGDSYDVHPAGDVVYTVSHSHNCTMINAFPDTSPRKRWQHAGGYTNYATGTNNGPDVYGWNYKGQPAPTMLHYYPDLGIGTTTGQYQAAWSVTGNSGYVAMGGEFPTVNNKPQQGLTRYAVRPTAPDKVGPQYLDTAPVRTTIPPTSAVSVSPGIIRVSFGAAWDQDDSNLTYKVYRDKGTAGEKLVKTISLKSNFWTLPQQLATDTGVPAGDHTYQIAITDPAGNELLSPTSNPVSATSTASPYAAQVSLDGADHFWRLGDSGTTTYDSIADADGTAGSGVTRGATGAIADDADQASSFNGTTSGTIGMGTLNSPTAAPDTFTAEGWFKTTSTAGGKILGYGTSLTGSSGGYDRHVYLNNAGKVTFGVYPGSTKTITSPTAYNDGQWHMFTASLDAGGMALYLDGRLIGRDVSATKGQSMKGWWRIGGDTVGSWPNAGSSNLLNGSIDDVAIYPSVLTPAQINQHLQLSGRTPTAPASAPADAYGADVFGANPDLYWRMNETGGPVLNDATAADNRGIVTGTPAYGQAGALTTTTNKSISLGTSGAYLSSASKVAAPPAYSEELWFKTSGTSGGKLIGFGNAATGWSGTIDRGVQMLNNGKLRFGVLNGGNSVTIDSPNSYNDNQWHYLVARQSEDGIALFVDGVSVGTNANGSTATFAGYWRVGYDRVLSGSSSSAFNGSIDEVAVYSRSLSLDEIKSRFRKGGGTVPNTPPSPSFTVDPAGLKVSFSGASSTDADGSVTGYSWNFGDGTPAVTSATANHTYATAGTYQVSLTVTDNDGATAAATQSVTVSNGAPTADFASSENQLKVSLDASTSADTDGTITGYDWDFGDGTTGTGVTPQHTYAAAGTYTIGLTVTDNAGGTGTLSRTVTLALANTAPTAAFTSTASALAVAFDGSTSTDPDGTLASYAWTFGDGATDTGVTPSHTYAAPGSYPVKLTVTDNAGATGAKTVTVTVAAANVKPTAAFTSSAVDLVVSFDAGDSTDADGTIASYGWDFGDGSSAGSGKNPDHTYPAAGSYPVKLTVTDDAGATDTQTKTVTVTGPIAGPIAKDGFARTSTTGWGNAEVGGAWTYSGSTSLFAVADNTGTIKMAAPGSGPTAKLGVSSTDTDLQFDFSFDKAPTGGGQFVRAIARGTQTDGYAARVWVKSNNTMVLYLSRIVNGSETDVDTKVLTSSFAPNTAYTVRVQTSGSSPTTLRAKTWLTSANEPGSWSVSGTDTTASLQDAGGIAIRAYLSGSATSAPVQLAISNLLARPTGN